ncbi:hypothetical protein B0H14DRAFT_3564223 [Mycena olivaceomarginata]|nr:hypothetical protein B0H14DRAFT_3564223 [Mycena olivaceomarginata]
MENGWTVLVSTVWFTLEISRQQTYTSHESEETRSSVDEDQIDYKEQSLSTEDRIYNVKTVPEKRSFGHSTAHRRDYIQFQVHSPSLNLVGRDIMTQTGSGIFQYELALRCLVLQAKAQLIEMHRISILTKEKLITRLDKIEARYEEVATWPSPAKRTGLSNCGDANGEGCWGCLSARIFVEC